MRCFEKIIFSKIRVYRRLFYKKNPSNFENQYVAQMQNVTLRKGKPRVKMLHLCTVHAVYINNYKIKFVLEPK